ncbi:hypothetical protein FRB99_007045 [Tulasnella sp. 403]|nr:hypothetical protein FRB99_007045 [Tulasnella sp. 403]
MSLLSRLLCFTLLLVLVATGPVSRLATHRLNLDPFGLLAKSRGQTSPASGIGSRDTNAKRFAAGLPPLPPARKSRTRRILAPRSSPIPVASGQLGLRYDNGQALATDVVTMTLLDIGLPYYVAQWTNSGSSSPAYIGFAAYNDDRGYATTGTYNFASLNGLPWLNDNLTPAQSPSDPTILYETAVWTYDPTTRSLTAHWVNGDGTEPPEQPYLYTPTQGDQQVGITGDFPYLQNFVEGAGTLEKINFFLK